MSKGIVKIQKITWDEKKNGVSKIQTRTLINSDTIRVSLKRQLRENKKLLSIWFAVWKNLNDLWYCLYTNTFIAKQKWVTIKKICNIFNGITFLNQVYIHMMSLILYIQDRTKYVIVWNFIDFIGKLCFVIINL